jgi:uncharacterized SAM-binding protein YcdF (DUF218 family)
LAAIASPLTVEDPVAPVDVIVVSMAAARADAFEAAALYQAGTSRRLLLPYWQPDPLDVELQRMGVPYLPVTELVQAILERSGVPHDAIEVLTEPIDGLNAEVAAVGAALRPRPPRSLLYLTARSHTRRARWLLGRVLPRETTIRVRGPRRDAFDPATWWHTRGTGREVAMEYMRWLNTFVLRDFWRGAVPAVPEEPR